MPSARQRSTRRPSCPDTALARVDKREKRLAQTEATYRERTRELDEREEEVERREARYETDFEIRLEKLEAREKAVAELEERLGSEGEPSSPPTSRRPRARFSAASPSGGTSSSERR